MKPYALLADLHLHAWSAFSHTLPLGINSRLEMLLNEVERAAKEVTAAGGDTLVLAGDIFHVRGSVAPTVLNPTRDRLQHITANYGVQVLIMPGNHDLEGRDSTRVGSAVTSLEIDGYVSVFNDIAVWDAAMSGGQKVAMIPWVERIDDLKAILESLDGATPGMVLNQTDLILHAPIDGVIEGLPAHGLDPWFLAGLGFKRVFAGHYHNHKLMHPGLVGGGEHYGQVYSIGALAHHTWSDVGSKAGFLLVYPDRVEWRKSHLPQFIDLTRAEYSPEEMPLVVPDNYVKVRVTAAAAKMVEAAKQELLAMGAREVIVQVEPAAPVREGTTAATVAAGASLEVAVSDFVTQTASAEMVKDVATEALDVLGAAVEEA